MSLYTDIKSRIKDAMKAKDAPTLQALRNLVAACDNELIAKKTAATELTDEEVLTVIRRLAKQRKDSIEQFTKGGRADLAASETAELGILEKFLPAMMPREAILPVAKAVMEKMGLATSGTHGAGVADKSKVGQVTGAVMKELKGKADGADVKAVVEGLFTK